ncbi:MAG: polyphosphate kinase 1, partial [Bacteroidota bacterium]
MEKMNRKIINREISWLSFNHRVLQEAEDPNVPLIERLRFLGIFSNNLDEFFKVRVATIKRMIDLRINPLKAVGDNPKNVLNQIQTNVIKLQDRFGYIYANLQKELEKENIFIINEMEVDPKQSDYIHKYFRKHILPVLSTILLRDDLPFPYLKDKSIYLATKLCCNSHDKPDYALIEIPSRTMSRFVVLPSEDHRVYVILLDDVIRLCLDEVFSIFNYDHFEAYTIKLTRDAELDIDNDLNKSILEKISKGVSGRSKGQPVRFLYDVRMPADLLEFIVNALRFDKYDNLIPGARYHNFRDFMKFPTLNRPDLEHEKFPPLTHRNLQSGQRLLNKIKEKDLLLHFPYHSFDQYVNMLRESSLDPDVVEIKSTLYRVADGSKVVNALINAARNGKKVTVNIELQARFDEEANIYWSRKLEAVGANVLFGVPGLKVHSKLTLVRRKENGKLVDYACVGTGNFHEGTARVYTDVLLCTADKRITGDVKKVFDLFENTYYNYSFRNLVVSPLNQRRKIYQLIDNEIKNARQGKEAYLLLKINNLV